MILGVDYASVDGNAAPDLRKAYASGLRFGIVRGTYNTWTDPTLRRDWDALKHAGIVRGAYAFPVYAGSPEEEGKAFCNAVGDLGPGDLPPILDIEFPGHGISDTGMTPQQALMWLCKMAVIIRDRYGCLMLYTSGRVWHEDLHDIVSAFFADCPLWLARYTYGTKQEPHLSGTLLPAVVPPQLGDQDDFWIHQFQGYAIHFPGFDKTVDINLFRALDTKSIDRQTARSTYVVERLGLPANAAFLSISVATMRYQAAHGLSADGVIGPKTFAQLCWENL